MGMKQNNEKRFGKTVRSGQRWLKMNASREDMEESPSKPESDANGIVVRKIDQINCYN